MFHEKYNLRGKLDQKIWQLLKETVKSRDIKIAMQSKDCSKAAMWLEL